MASHPSTEAGRVAAAHRVSTPEYRARHISMLWSQQLWHEAIMVAFGVGAVALLFCAIAKDVASWVL